MAGVWHLPVEQKAGQLCGALHPQPLLQCLKAGESQTKICSRSGTSFIHLPFQLAKAIFPFLLQSPCLQFSEWHPGAIFYLLPTSPVRCYWLGETYPLPTQKSPDLTKTSKCRQKVGLYSHHHTQGL